ncbi:MAG: NAD-dependent epimerase/dehydratase family protein [archaeon]
MKNKVCLVTGGAGAIGSNLARALAASCEKLVILDNLSSGHAENVPQEDNVTFINDSILNNDVLDKVMPGTDVVFHLAANFANQNSVDHPRKDLRVNGMGTLKLLQAAVRHDVERFVYSSSSCVYGNRAGVLDESCKEYNLDTPYAITKLLGERYTTLFHEFHGLKTVILRYFNTYGPGEYPGRYRNVIPNFIELAMKGRPLPITGTGDETRDFTFIADSVDGTLKAAAVGRAVGKVINFGSGKETRIIDLANKINELAGNDAGVVFNERRNWDTVKSRRAGIGVAKDILGFNPKTGLDEGLAKTHEWLRDHLK